LLRNRAAGSGASWPRLIVAVYAGRLRTLIRNIKKDIDYFRRSIYDGGIADLSPRRHVTSNPSRVENEISAPAGVSTQPALYDLASQKSCAKEVLSS
jgi:hypothetical protein